MTETAGQKTQRQKLDVEVLRQWLHATVCMLVTDEDAVKVAVAGGEGGVLFSLSVGASDTGKVLGKKGCIAEALRLLLTAQGMEHGIRPHLDVLVDAKAKPKRKLTRELTKGV